MATLSRSAFGRSLRDLDADGFRRFVRDLHEARGRSVGVDGDLLSVETANGAPRRLLVHWPSRWLPARLSRRSTPPAADRPDRAVDAVVTPYPARSRSLAAALDARLVGPDDLYRTALYGLDRAACDDLLGRHLDRSVTVPDGSPAGRRHRDPSARSPAAGPGTGTGTGTGTGSGSTADAGLSAAVLGPVGVVLVVLVVVAGAFPGALGVGAPTPTVPSGGTQTPTPTATPGGAADTGASPATPEPGSIAPGLSQDGVVDIEALQRAHARTASERSYRWRFYFSVRSNGTIVDSVERTVRYERPDRYVASVGYSGSVRGPSTAGSRHVYADGTHRYVQRESLGAVSYSRRHIEDGGDGRRFAERAATYVGWFLDANRTSVTDVYDRNMTFLYRVRATGVGVDRATSYSAAAIVDPRGMVRAFWATYEIPNTDRRVSVSFWYEGIGETRVEPPDWYDEARNATGSGTDTATTSDADAATTPDGNSTEVPTDESTEVPVDGSTETPGNVTAETTG